MFRIDYADSLCKWIRIASHLGDMLSTKAFAQRMGALCEWIERVALCLMIRIANQVAMQLVGVWDYYSFYSNSEWVSLCECLRSLSHCLRLSHSELGRYARSLGV
ncbi:hypothetical protein LR48_Vigan06g097400 [Vigna angularis]|uniref:Uncharacterized protein n=1 Tax=Phaseolus angularis TaxID=3914 RepID=A0A0L9USD6_PHAAN|nr:hypothetical protein LR48_Vigan06g097400 [Vigna angularis]